MSADIEFVLREYELIPDVISTVPGRLLKVTYQNGLAVNAGAELTPTQVKSAPEVLWDAEPDTYYTLIMTDLDAPSRKNPLFREINHWLVANIPGNDLSKGNEIRGYRGSGPPAGSGLHRYVFLLYKQPHEIEPNETRADSSNRNGRVFFNTNEFAEKYALGAPVAINFYQAQHDDYVNVLRQQSSMLDNISFIVNATSTLIAKKLGFR